MQQSLILLQAAGNRKSEADALNNIGLIYTNWGDRESASDYYNRALQLHQVEGNQAGQAATLNNLATLYMLSDPQKSQDYLLRALLLARASEDRAGEGSIYNTACVIYMRLGDIAGAFKICLTALKIHQETGNEEAAAATLANIGGLFRIGNNEPQALEFFNWALSSYRAVGNRSGEAFTLFSMADIYRNQGNLEAALEKISAAVNIFENLRTDINSESSRISFFSTSSVQLGYSSSISLLADLGHNGEAFNISERSRARTLIELLAESRIDSSQATNNPELKDLYERKQELESQLSARENLIQNARSEEIRAQHQQEYQRLDAELKDNVEPQIKQKDPAYAAIRYPTPLTLNQVQRDVLDDDTVLLQYAIGEQQSYLFSVTKAEMKSYVLPSRRTEIETAAGKLLAHLKASRDDDAILQAGACLRQKILPKEILQSAADKKLVIAADGILQTVPFAALPLPDPDAPETDACDDKSFNLDKSQRYQPLIEKYEIVNVPSITSVQILRAQQQAPAPKTLAILADPIFTTDPRTKQQAQLVCENTSRGEAVPPETLPIEPQAALRSTRDTYAPLPCTRSEANAILQEINDAPQTLEALDYAATQAWVTTAPLSDYRIVHFATHGIINDRNPELSGLVLSQVDQQGKPIEDYYLRLNDIFNLKLNADLVVLSACETGLGEDVRGEGIIGLTRGFMYAGAKRVMTSFWKVEDGSTARLMTRFYHFMLKDNLSPSAALGQAQREMWQDSASAEQWAAFTIQGEWN